MKNITQNQIRYIPQDELVSEVITLQEASEILGCCDSTLRKQILKGQFQEWEYRKSKGTILFNKSIILEKKKLTVSMDKKSLVKKCR